LILGRRRISLRACCRTRTRYSVGDGVLPGVEIEGDSEIVEHHTTSAPRRSDPSESIPLTDEPWFTRQLCLIYGAAWRGPLPTNLGRPRSRPSTKDQKLQQDHDISDASCSIKFKPRQDMNCAHACKWSTGTNINSIATRGTRLEKPRPEAQSKPHARNIKLLSNDRKERPQSVWQLAFACLVPATTTTETSTTEY
jgi:hypothetical protein